VLAIAVVLLWAVSGPVFGWSDTWQLVINTGTTIITFPLEQGIRTFGPPKRGALKEAQLSSSRGVSAAIRAFTRPAL